MFKTKRTQYQNKINEKTHFTKEQLDLSEIGHLWDKL